MLSTGLKTAEGMCSVALRRSAAIFDEDIVEKSRKTTGVDLELEGS